ncbi:MAG: hypothetical protein U1E49_09470 [Hyphomicrobiaceae bacterium]
MKFSQVARLAMFAATLLLGAAGVATTADARKEFTVHGGVGDISNASVCPTGHFIVGFRGRTGLWIDQIRIRCAPLLNGGGVGDSKAMSGVGGSGGGDAKAKCIPGHVVNGINFFTTDQNRQVELITFTCMNPDDRSMAGGYEMYGNTAGVRFNHYKQTCPDGEAAVGLNHRWGDHVNAIGLICDVLRRP